MRRRPLVLAFGRFDGDGGTEHISAAVIEDISRHCDVLLWAWGRSGHFFATLIPHVQNVHRFFTGRWSGVRNAVRLWLFIGALRPQALIAFDYRMALPLGMALSWLPKSRRPRSVLSHHLPIAFRLDQAGSRERARAHAYLPLFDVHTVPSPAITGDLRQALPAIPAQRIRILPNGIDAAALQRQAEQPFLLPSSPTGVRFHCVSVGALRPDKRVDLLLQAMHELPDREHCQLVIIGDGPERGRLEAMAGELDLAERCLFLGAMGNPHPLLARADLFVQISRRETFGLAPLEAMAHGVPVLAMCEHGDGLRTVLQDGVQGRLIEGANLQAFVQAWHSLLADAGMRRRMGEAGKLQAQRFSARDMCQGYRRLLGLEV